MSDKESANLPTPTDQHTLVDLIRTYQHLLNEIATAGGELTPEVEQALSAVDVQLPAKVDGYKFIIDRFEQEAEYWKRAGAEARRYQQASENLVDRVKDGLKVGLQVLSKDEAMGNRFRAKLVRSQVRLVVSDEGQVPGNFFDEEVQFILNKVRVKEALEKGEQVPGCHLEQGTALRWYSASSAVKEKKTIEAEAHKMVAQADDIDAVPKAKKGKAK